MIGIAQGSMPVGWLPVLRRYLAFVLIGNVTWEFAHLPLYTIWKTAPPSELAFAVAHCTAGDVLIASAALVASLVAIGRPDWPDSAFKRVAALTITLGVAYTVFSEWLNVVVRVNWAYAPSMPVVPVLGIGLSPLLQWMVLPALGLWLARRSQRVS